LEKLDEMRKYAQMWRISDDIWDIWHNDGPYPKGLGDQFDNAAKWAGRAQPDIGPTRTCFRWGVWGLLPAGVSRAIPDLLAMNSEC